MKTDKSYHATLFVAVLAVVLSSGSDCDPPTVEDNGFHTPADTGVALHPGDLPLFVAPDETIDDATLVPEAIGWWNSELSSDNVARLAFLEAGGIDAPQVVVAYGYVPAPDSDLSGEGDPVGIAYLDYAEDGSVLSAEIVLSSDYSYHRPTMLKALEHELGHTLGLADDPGVDITVDLMSIMSSPLDPLGELTEHDFDLLEPYIPLGAE